jgi:hypothetical protein
MEPLDLGCHPPRGPRETMLGVMFLPRTIDKLRAELPGGNLAGYLTDYRNGLSSYLLHKLGIGFDELRAVVAAAASEDEIVEWLRSRIDAGVAEHVNAKLEQAKITTENREEIASRHPLLHGRTDLLTIFEVLEADDAATLSSRA